MTGLILITPWEHQPSSEATRKHLGLGTQEVWSRMWDGLARFIVLPPEMVPQTNEPGFTSLGDALFFKQFVERERTTKMSNVPLSEKTTMPEKPIIETSVQHIHMKLAADHDRFSDSTVLMSATEASFKTPDGSKGKIFVSIGGNEADVVIGERTWRINLSALAHAAWDCDQSYLKKIG